MPVVVERQDLRDIGGPDLVTQRVQRVGRSLQIVCVRCWHVSRSWNRCTLQLSCEGANNYVVNAVPIEWNNDRDGVEVFGLDRDRS